MRVFLSAALICTVALGGEAWAQSESPGPKMFSVYFEFGAAGLYDAGQDVVDAVADRFKTAGGTHIDIVGNTDTAEADVKQWVLSKADIAKCKALKPLDRSLRPLCVWKNPNAVKLGTLRAQIIVRRLVVDGVPRSAIRITSVGASKPAIPTPPGTREPLNRRAEVTVS